MQGDQNQERSAGAWGEKEVLMTQLKEPWTSGSLLTVSQLEVNSEVFYGKPKLTHRFICSCKRCLEEGSQGLYEAKTKALVFVHNHLQGHLKVAW